MTEHPTDTAIPIMLLLDSPVEVSLTGAGEDV